MAQLSSGEPLHFIAAQCRSDLNWVFQLMFLGTRIGQRRWCCFVVTKGSTGGRTCDKQVRRAQGTEQPWGGETTPKGIRSEGTAGQQGEAWRCSRDASGDGRRASWAGVCGALLSQDGNAPAVVLSSAERSHRRSRFAWTSGCPSHRHGLHQLLLRKWKVMRLDNLSNCQNWNPGFPCLFLRRICSYLCSFTCGGQQQKWEYQFHWKLKFENTFNKHRKQVGFSGVWSPHFSIAVDSCSRLLGQRGRAEAWVMMADRPEFWVCGRQVLCPLTPRCSP